MKELITPEWKNHKSKLKSLFHKLSSVELLKLSEPCYGPKLKKYENEIYATMGLDKNTMHKSIKDFYENSRVKGWLLESDAMTNLLILYMYYFLSVRDKNGFSSVMLYFNIRMYANLYHRFFKFCKPDVFLYTLETMNRSHIYAREKTIANAVYFFSKEMIRRWEHALKDLNEPDDISKFIRESRHRNAQSIKSFMEAYYRNVENGKSITTDYESISQTDGEGDKSVESTMRTPAVVEKLIDKITLYGFIDNEAISKAQSLTQVNRAYAEKMAGQLSNAIYHEHIHFILRFYISQLGKMSDLCSTGYIRGVRNLLRNKQPGPQEFKAHIAQLNQLLFKNLRMTPQYNKFTMQTRYAYIAFTTFYLTMTMRHHACGKI